MKQILVVGSSNTDLVVSTKRAPEGGETVIGSSFATNGGGKGANQAVAVQRIGGNCVFVSALGEDVFGRQMLQAFETEGMNTEYVVTKSGVSSGVALITIEDNGENRIVVVPGANALLDRHMIDKALPAIEACEYVIVQLEIPLDSVAYLVDIASRLNKKVILNPAPACPLSDELLSKVYLITPNETEAGLLSGVTVTDDETAVKAARQLMSKGVKNVIITMGSRGSLVVTADETTFVSSFKVKAVDTVAAGDTFNGALAVALNEGMAMTEAARFASAASAIAVTRHGAQNSVPTRAEVEGMIHSS